MGEFYNKLFTLKCFQFYGEKQSVKNKRLLLIDLTKIYRSLSENAHIVISKEGDLTSSYYLLHMQSQNDTDPLLFPNKFHLNTIFSSYLIITILVVNVYFNIHTCMGSCWDLMFCSF